MKNPPVRTRDPDTDATDAFEVHSALLHAEAQRPALRQNPRWNLVRMDAYEAFHNLMTGSDHGGH